jgi:LAGLIDADG DNA endonuclease family
LKFQQSDARHRDYLWHLHSLYSEWVLSSRPFYDPTQAMWSFQTISHSEFCSLATLFILDRDGNRSQKHIQHGLIEKYLTPLENWTNFQKGLAYWFMDDGGRLSYNKDYERKGFVLNTHSFSQNQVELLCQGLEEKFRLKCWPKQNKKNGSL